MTVEMKLGDEGVTNINPANGVISSLNPVKKDTSFINHGYEDENETKVDGEEQVETILFKENDYEEVGHLDIHFDSSVGTASSDTPSSHTSSSSESEESDSVDKYVDDLFNFK